MYALQPPAFHHLRGVFLHGYLVEIPGSEDKRGQALFEVIGIARQFLLIAQSLKFIAVLLCLFLQAVFLEFGIRAPDLNGIGLT